MLIDDLCIFKFKSSKKVMNLEYQLVKFLKLVRVLRFIMIYEYIEWSKH